MRCVLVHCLYLLLRINTAVHAAPLVVVSGFDPSLSRSNLLDHKAEQHPQVAQIATQPQTVLVTSIEVDRMHGDSIDCAQFPEQVKRLKERVQAYLAVKWRKPVHVEFVRDIAFGIDDVEADFSFQYEVHSVSDPEGEVLVFRESGFFASAPVPDSLPARPGPPTGSSDDIPSTRLDNPVRSNLLYARSGQLGVHARANHGAKIPLIVLNDGTIHVTSIKNDLHSGGQERLQFPMTDSNAVLLRNRIQSYFEKTWGKQVQVEFRIDEQIKYELYDVEGGLLFEYEPCIVHGKRSCTGFVASASVLNPLASPSLTSTSSSEVDSDGYVTRL